MFFFKSLEENGFKYALDVESSLATQQRAELYCYEEMTSYLDALLFNRFRISLKPSYMFLSDLGGDVAQFAVMGLVCF